MSQSGTSTMTARRIERLLRSLVGVSDLRLHWTAESLRSVHILRDARVQPHQLIRNVVSGLQAGIGITILPTQVHVHENAGTLEAVVASAMNGNGNANGNGATAGGNPPHPAPQADAVAARESGGNGGAPAVANGSAPVRVTAVTAVERTRARAPARTPDAVLAAAELLRERREKADVHEALQLERIDLERRGAMLRCRTVLGLNGRTYSAIAEVPDAPAAEAELAARVALDALRAGGLTEATLEGVGFITISDINYCVATVRSPGATAPRAGAAAMIDSMAASATAAVLTALGTYTDARPKSRARIVNGTNANP